ncbi:hypothetical protein NW762_010454 [Fusarium torreyae]|uniref:Uncharacterized protein n=1 Tax=Fusarium torreyae TaxID=1237075 RepID=A0A9W8VA66_9HYPO|nr:hypothetical protein NW762_010454 [Fusarium torreyae]
MSSTAPGKQTSVSFSLPKPFRPTGIVTKTAQLLKRRFIRRNALYFDIGDFVIVKPCRIEHGVYITDGDWDYDIVMVFPNAEIGDFDHIFGDGADTLVHDDLRKMTNDQIADVFLTEPFDKICKLIHCDNVHKAYPKYQ